MAGTIRKLHNDGNTGVLAGAMVREDRFIVAEKLGDHRNRKDQT
jgi:hypothetical protein